MPRARKPKAKVEPPPTTTHPLEMTASPEASARFVLTRTLTLSVRSRVWRTRDKKVIKIVLAEYLCQAEIAMAEDGLVSYLMTAPVANTHRYLAETSAVNPMRIVATPGGGFEVVGNPELFEVAKLLSDRAELSVRADEFRGPLGDRDVRDVRGLELISSPGGTPTERAAQCLRDDLLPTSLRPDWRRPRAKPIGHQYIGIVGTIFGRTAPAIREHLRSPSRSPSAAGDTAARAKSADVEAESQSTHNATRQADDGVPGEAVPGGIPIAMGREPVIHRGAALAPSPEHARRRTKRLARSSPRPGKPQMDIGDWRRDFYQTIDEPSTDR